MSCGVLVLWLVSSVFCPVYAQTALHWQKYVTWDGSISFAYPRGWFVEERESGFLIEDEYTGEQLWLVVLPYERNWTARRHAQYFLDMIRQETPELQASNWEVDETGDIVLFALKYDEWADGAAGYGLVVKDPDFQQVVWFHYLAPDWVFDGDRALDILGTFVESVSSAESATAIAARMERIERNVDAFVFVLEFALGAPLSMEEEIIIAETMKSIFAELPESQLAAFDDYPYVMQVIMAVDDQVQLADIQRTLSESVWEWVEESDPNDQIVNLIRDALLDADRVLVPGRTPLTEVAATAYAEFYAFSERVANGGTPELGKISRGRVEDVRDLLVEAWRDLSESEKEQVLTMPAVWTTLRRVLTHGDAADRAYALRLIEDAAPRPADAWGPQTPLEEPMSWLQHQSMMQVHTSISKSWIWHNYYYGTLGTVGTW